MAIARTPIINDDGTCTTGTVIDDAWKQEFYDQIDVALGKWYDIPFDAANFYGSGGLVWTVTSAQVTTNRAVLAGNTLFWSIQIGGATLSGADGSSLYLKIPYGIASLGSGQSLGKTYDGTGGWALVDVVRNRGSNVMTINKFDFSNFHVNSGSTFLYFSTWVDVA